MSATAQIQIAASAPPGPITATVTTGSERATATFTINAQTVAPAITQNPSSLTVVTGSGAPTSEGFCLKSERLLYGREPNDVEGGTGKAEVAKLQDAGISLKQCPEK